MTKKFLREKTKNDAAHFTAEEFKRRALSTSIFFISIFIGASLRYILTKLRMIHLPLEGLLLVLGAMVGLIVAVTDYQDPLDKQQAEFEMILNLSLPLLVLRICLFTDFAHFKKTFGQIILVSVPGALLSALFICGVAKYFLNWAVLNGFLLGLMITVVFPINLIALLKKLSSSKCRHVTVLLEGEAFMCIVFIKILLEGTKVLSGNILQSNLYIAMYIISKLFFGPIVGYFFGLILCASIRRAAGDIASVTIITIASPLAIYLTVNMLECSGLAALVVLGIMMGRERSILPAEVELVLLNIWDAIYIATSAFLVSFVGHLFGLITYASIQPDKGPFVFISYILCYFSRFLVYILCAPILSRIGYGMSFRQMVITVWAGIHSSPNLYFAYEVMSLYPAKIAHPLLFHVACVCLFSMFINELTIPYLLTCFGMKALTLSKEQNMNRCVKYLLKMRLVGIDSLKLDRYFSDANWIFVMAQSYIKHPYWNSANVAKEDEDEIYVNMGLAICPNCEKEVVRQPTPQEFEEVTKEARRRVLQTMKVIYSRLYEKGMLGLDSMQILTNAADIDMETNDVSFRIDDIQNMFKHIGIFERLSRIKQVLKTKQKSKKVIRKPNTYWRRKSYHLINNFIYENILHLIVFLNCISIMTCFLTNPKPRSPVNVLCLICDLFFALVYTLQMIVSILGKSSRSLWDGIRRYFSSFWDIFDFVIVITSWVCFADSIYELHETSESKMRLFRTVSLFRMIRIVRLGKLFAPAIDKLADMETNNILTEAYDLGKGYISTVQEILTMLPYMIDNKDVREDTRVRLEIKQSLISRELNLVQMRRPWIGIRNKTNQAIHRTINVMIDAVGELKSAGLIDDAERTKILNSLLKQLKYIQGIKSNAPNSPRVLFEEVSWMGEDKALIDFLFTNIVIKSYEPSEMIINEGDHAPGVCIMITGLLTVNYKPVEDVLKDLVKEGALPVSDYLPYYKFEATTIDYIVSGNSFGELNFLTKRPYACQIVADSLSQVYMVTNDIMEYALEVDNDPVNGLRSRMWKLISTRVATAILMEVPMYRSTRDDEVRYCLERAFVPDLSKYLVFVKLSLIEDILLIEGIATDLNTKESFVAPCYIPRNVKRISLHTSTGITGNVKTILLIIPTKDVTPHDLMEKEEKAAELIKDAGEKVGALDLEDTKIKRKKRKGVSSNKQDNSSGSSSEGSKKGDQNKEAFSTLRKKRQSTVVEQSLTSPQ